MLFHTQPRLYEIIPQTAELSTDCHEIKWAWETYSLTFCKSSYSWHESTHTGNQGNHQATAETQRAGLFHYLASNTEQQRGTGTQALLGLAYPSTLRWGWVGVGSAAHPDVSKAFMRKLFKYYLLNKSFSFNSFLPTPIHPNTYTWPICM